MNKKRLIILLVLVLLVLLVGVSVYYFYFRDKGPEAELAPEQTSGQPTTPGEHVVVVDEKLKRISAGPAVSPVASENGSRVLYVGKSGGIFEIGFDGSELKENKFVAQQNLFRALWSKDRREFIALYSNAGQRKLFYNNRATGKTAALEGVSAPAIGVGNSIAYYRAGSGAGENAIVLADMSGASAETLLNTRLMDVRLEWAGEKDIAVYTAPSGLAQSSLWLLNTATRKMSSLLTNISGLTIKWDAAGEKMLYSQTQNNGRALSLWTIGKTGLGAKELGVKTLPEKCVFAHDMKNVLCVVATIEPDIVWPDDYYKQLYKTSEQVWRIGLGSNTKDMLYEFTTNFDATDLVLSPKGDMLAFLNRADGYLYGLSLK